MALALALAVAGCTVRQAGPFPEPQMDEPTPAGPRMESVVLAGGCFWGIQLVFENVRGVQSATAGYAGGGAATAHYEQVSTGRTGHAESVKVVYDASQVSLGQLLRVFFSVAHDPTEWMHQGPDAGAQYRSVIFYSDPEQQDIAAAYIRQLSAAHAYPRPIVTELTPLSAFYAAEDFHQDYALHNPGDPYIRINDLPKLAALRAEWPQLARPPLVR
ncbi:MAG TPA: peptide-methionine (S)-S-oxide reductase MsrA [Terriglobales bacterium]